MDALPYYKWHWQRWRANRRVQRMTPAQKGIYRDLLDECWAEGSIPDDHDALAEIVGCDKQEITDAWHVLSNCFYEVAPGRLTNSVLEEQRTENDALRAKRAVAGAAGGKQKLANAKQEPYRREEKTIEEKNNTLASTANAVPAGRKLICTIPVVSPKTDVPIYDDDLQRWRETYPAVDVKQQLREFKQWCVDNPTRRKTRTGLRKSINYWLGKEQDKAGYGQIQQRQSYATREEKTLSAAQNASRFDQEIADNPRGKPTGDPARDGIRNLLQWAGRVPPGRPRDEHRGTLLEGETGGQNGLSVVSHNRERDTTSGQQALSASETAT